MGDVLSSCHVVVSAQTRTHAAHAVVASHAHAHVHAHAHAPPPQKKHTRHTQWGVAYRLAGTAEEQQAALAYLEWREKQYDQRHRAHVFSSSDPEQPVVHDALVYVATAGNVNWLGPARLQDIAAQVARAVGPSGPNREYVFKLSDAMRQVGVCACTWASWWCACDRCSEPHQAGRVNAAAAARCRWVWRTLSSSRWRQQCGSTWRQRQQSKAVKQLQHAWPHQSLGAAVWTSPCR
jgi:hypothetical protein